MEENAEGNWNQQFSEEWIKIMQIYQQFADVLSLGNFSIQIRRVKKVSNVLISQRNSIWSEKKNHQKIIFIFSCYAKSSPLSVCGWIHQNWMMSDIKENFYLIKRDENSTKENFAVEVPATNGNIKLWVKFANEETNGNNLKQRMEREF